MDAVLVIPSPLVVAVVAVAIVLVTVVSPGPARDALIGLVSWSQVFNGDVPSVHALSVTTPAYERAEL